MKSKAAQRYFVCSIVIVGSDFDCEMDLSDIVADCASIIEEKTNNLLNASRRSD